MSKLRKVRRSTKSKRVQWVGAPDVRKRVIHLLDSLGFDNFTRSRIFCVRSQGAKTNAYARIWGLSSIWQKTLRQSPAYIIEVVSEKFDHLAVREKDRILLHEIAHIPMNFSGALLPHRRRGKGSFHDKLQRLIVGYER